MPAALHERRVVAASDLWRGLIRRGRTSAAVAAGTAEALAYLSVEDEPAQTLPRRRLRVMSQVITAAATSTPLTTQYGADPALGPSQL